jgi:DNA invertase Pin-like site-specific DNA recombinase
LGTIAPSPRDSYVPASTIPARFASGKGARSLCKVRSAAQNLDRQLGALRAARCDQIFAEKLSGNSPKGRPQVVKAIDALRTGDVFVVARWDRATMSMMDGNAIIDCVLAR